MSVSRIRPLFIPSLPVCLHSDHSHHHLSGITRMTAVISPAVTLHLTAVISPGKVISPLSTLQWFPPFPSDSKSKFSQWPIRSYTLSLSQPQPLTSLNPFPTPIFLVHVILATVAPLFFLKLSGSSPPQVLHWLFPLPGILQDST